ncbi:glycolate oxidase subunit GlcE [Deinococcus phoenicis]|uniref:Glycolate oxidase subunit GlcE n=1 Tax=Deinococcus phoenicis TaxID=1476583 RepID=A0A016QN91_9DEIO|nr:glycolate oxidase subunit GlcE [Deinococcus phoenicis]
MLEVYAALPAGLFPPFPPVELPGGVGGLVVRGGFGQTFFFGAEVLGVTFRAPSGRVIRAGGRTVKNVQGYDLTRPFVGSFGALGEALEVTLRLRPGLSVRHVLAPGTLAALGHLTARFAWQDGAEVHLMHFGHAREVERALGLWPGAREVTGPLDLTSRFPAGMGVGEGAALRDRRFGWVDGGEVPPVPPLFARVAARL